MEYSPDENTEAEKKIKSNQTNAEANVIMNMCERNAKKKCNRNGSSRFIHMDWMSIGESNKRHTHRQPNNI